MIPKTKISDVGYMFVIKLADVVITEIAVPSLEDPIKLKHAKMRLPIALRYIDTEKFKVNKPIEEREYDIGFIGRFEPEKGLYEFIAAILMLRTKGYNPRVLMAGGGSLFSLAKKYESKLNATILSYVPHNRMPELYNNIKILVLPSKKEGVPTVLLEALACGIIPVVSRVGGMPWVIQRAKVSTVLESVSPESISKALERLLNLPHKILNEMSWNGRKFVENYLTLDKAIVRYNILKKLLTSLARQK